MQILNSTIAEPTLQDIVDIDTALHEAKTRYEELTNERGKLIYLRLQQVQDPVKERKSICSLLGFGESNMTRILNDVRTAIKNGGFMFAPLCLNTDVLTYAGIGMVLLVAGLLLLFVNALGQENTKGW